MPLPQDHYEKLSFSSSAYRRIQWSQSAMLWSRLPSLHPQEKEKKKVGEFKSWESKSNDAICLLFFPSNKVRPFFAGIPIEECPTHLWKKWIMQRKKKERLNKQITISEWCHISHAVLLPLSGGDYSKTLVVPHNSSSVISEPEDISWRAKHIATAFSRGVPFSRLLLYILYCLNEVHREEVNIA